MMHTLSFSLTLEGVVRIHDAVLCLAKFSEVVSLEARKDKVGETPPSLVYVYIPTNQQYRTSLSLLP